MTKGRVVLAAVVATLAAFLMIQTASAQYPPPRGGIVCIVNQISVKSESAVEISAVVRDSGGNAVSGVSVFFNIVSQPGDSASLETAVETTDGSGTASTKLFAGLDQGQLVVSATTEDDLECRVITEVLGEVRFVIQPPSTGDGGLAGGTNAIDAGTWALIALAGLSGSVLLVLVLRGFVREQTYR